MSAENVKIARAAVDAVAQMDLPHLLEITDPDCEWHSFLAELGQDGVYTGHDGIRQYVSDLRDAWEVFEAEEKDIFAMNDVVLLLSELRYRGKASGVDLTSHVGHLAKFREGRIVYMRAFRDQGEALEAAGLSE